MPQLPSGLNVGLDPRPLSALLNEAPLPWNIHKVMAINNAQELYPYLDVTLFIPEAEQRIHRAAAQFAELEVGKSEIRRLVESKIAVSLKPIQER